MTTIANCFDLNEATQLKMILESAGVEAFIPDEISAGVAPFLALTEGGVRVQVADEKAEEAREIIRREKEAS